MAADLLLHAGDLLDQGLVVDEEGEGTLDLPADEGAPDEDPRRLVGIDPAEGDGPGRGR